MRTSLVLPLLLLWLVACSESLPLGAPATPREGEEDVRVEHGEDVDADLEPSLTLLVPQPQDLISSQRLWVQGSARGPVVQVALRIGDQPPRILSLDGRRRWEATVEVPWSDFELRAQALDARGAPIGRELRVPLLRRPATDDATLPEVTVLSPDPLRVSPRLDVWLRGVTNEGARVVALFVEHDGQQMDPSAVLSDDGFRTWAVPVALHPSRENHFLVRALDVYGNVAIAEHRVVARPAASRGAPWMAWEGGLPDEVEQATLNLRGRYRAPNGVRSLHWRTSTPDPLLSSGWRPGAWQRIDPTEPFAFNQDVPLRAGLQRLEVRLVDALGLATRLEHRLTNRARAQLGEERAYTLRLRRDEQPWLTFSLGRQGLDEVFSQSLQEEIVLLRLDLRPLLRNVLAEIKTACGTRWQEDHPDPRHDCSVTPLGRTFRGPDGTWRTSPEYALVRLLTMTPANVQVRGTSIAGLQELADGRFFGITIGGGFSQILADALGVARTAEIVSTEAVVDALQAGVLATHPGMDEAGRLPLSLRDALLELEPLGGKLGPRGTHPGIIDPNDPPRAALLEPDFRFVLAARSRLAWWEGVELGVDKTYLARMPGEGAALAFDFLDPARFRLDGLVEAPRADLRFIVNESPRFVSSCNNRTVCQQNLPDAPLDVTSLWALEPWLLERIIAFAAFQDYRQRRFQRCYIQFLGCQASVELGQGSDPAGWTRFRILFNLGDPPRDQYVWELISEVGQVALHRVPAGTIPEGDANVAFTLREVSVGLSAEELLAALRPYLQDQAGLLSERLLGDIARNNGRPDFTLEATPAGAFFLRFAHPSDALPQGTAAHRRPGFFAAPSLAENTRRSLTTLPQEDDSTPHEKLLLPAGEEVVVFVEARDGQIYRLRMTAPTGPLPNSLVVHAAPYTP